MCTHIYTHSYTYQIITQIIITHYKIIYDLNGIDYTYRIHDLTNVGVYYKHEVKKFISILSIYYRK